MIVQRRADGVRIIDQHEHGLLSGVLAGAWHAPRGFEQILLAGLHDLAWRRSDADPVFDPGLGLPYDFLTLPKAPRVVHYTEGLDELEQISAFAGLMTSRHYVSIVGRSAPEAWIEAERIRQARLRVRLSSWSDEGLDEALEWLRFFDTLSLFFCMTPPSALGVESLPGWLDPAVFARAVPESGPRPAFRWLSDEALAMDPFLFQGEALEVEIPYRAVSETRFGDEGSMRAALGSARRGVWRASIVSG